MTQEVKDVFDELVAQVKYLRLRWKMYNQLYGTSEERVDLLNRAAPLFFEVVEQELRYSVILTLSQLTDDVGKGKNQCLSIKRLRNMMDESPRDSIGIDDKINVVDGLIKPLRDHRNRRIAHNDWGKRERELPDLCRADITNAIAKVQQLLEEVHGLYFGSGHASMLFKWRGGYGDGDLLIKNLERSNCEAPTMKELYGP